MNYRNAHVFTEDFRFEKTGFSVVDGKFADVGMEKANAIDLEGAFVIPGLIDVHNHGNSSKDFSDGIVRNKITAGHSRTSIFFSYIIIFFF